MPSNHTRAERIANKKRIKNKYRKDLLSWGWPESTPEWIDMRVKYASENRKDCSCILCRNPRKLWKEKTLQEKISDINFKEEINE